MLIKYLFLTENKSTEKFTLELNTRGVPAPKGGTWSCSQVERVLKHPFHCGMVICGKKRWKKDRTTGKKKMIAKASEDKWIIGEGNN